MNHPQDQKATIKRAGRNFCTLPGDNGVGEEEQARKSQLVESSILINQKKLVKKRQNHLNTGVWASSSLFLGFTKDVRSPESA